MYYTLLFRNEPVGFDEWLKENFNQADCDSFYEALQKNNDLWRSYLDQGMITHEPIYENVYIPELDDDFDIMVGTKIILNAGTDPIALQMHPDFARWMKIIPENLHTPVPFNYI